MKYRYLEVDRETAESHYKVFRINICVYQGVNSNDFIKQATVKRPQGTSQTLFVEEKNIIKDLPSNIHYSLKYYLLIDDKGNIM